MRIHPASALLGLAVAGLCLVTMSQSATTIGTPLRVEYIPHPSDMVQIEEGVPFTVPAGKLFVPTAMGVATSTQGYNVAFLVNAQEEFRVYTAVGNPGSNAAAPATPCTMKSIPIGRAVPAGSVITVSDLGGENFGRAWGYLAAAQ